MKLKKLLKRYEPNPYELVVNNSRMNVVNSYEQTGLEDCLLNADVIEINVGLNTTTFLPYLVIYI